MLHCKNATLTLSINESSYNLPCDVELYKIKIINNNIIIIIINTIYDSRDYHLMNQISLHFEQLF